MILETEMESVCVCVKRAFDHSAIALCAGVNRSYARVMQPRRRDDSEDGVCVFV